MCLPLVVVAGIGIALSAAAGAMSAVTASNASKAEAAQYKVAATQAATAASADSRMRMREFEEQDAVNRASIAASGLTSGSFDSVLDANRLTAQDDATQIEQSGRNEYLRNRFAAKQAKTEARGALVGGLLNTAGNVFTGIAGMPTG